LGPVTARVSGEFGVRHGDRVWLTPPANRIHRFDDEGKAM
jgi:multiple sugar transport system ATP-binding protein